MTTTEPTYTPDPDTKEVMPSSDAEQRGSATLRVTEGDGAMTPTVDDPNQGEPDPLGSSLGVHQGVPFSLPIDPAEAHALLSSLMRRYARHAKHAEVINKSAQMQLEEIEEERLREITTDTKEMVALIEQMRPLARMLLPIDPKHRKTVSTTYGEVSFREGSTSLAVDDTDAYMPWARAREIAAKDDVAWTRSAPVPQPAPNLHGLHRAISDGDVVVNDDGSLSLKGEDGERIPIPGVRQVKGEETFTVKPR